MAIIHQDKESSNKVKESGYIFIRPVGGLGNQLFIYANALNLSCSYNKKIRIDRHTGFMNDAYKHKYALYHFDLKTITFPFIVSIIIRVMEKVPSLRALLKYWLNIEEIPELNNRQFVQIDINDSSKNLYVHGYYQSELYFRNVIPKLKTLLNLDHIDLNEKQEKVLEKIKKSNAIAVHARRNRSLNVGNEWKSLTADYYIDAINTIESSFQDPIHLFFFGDDPTWLNDNLGSLWPCTAIKGNSDVVDLHLMSSCNHFVIANSTFSWWGAWLGKHESKIVHAPDSKIWSANHDILPEEWIKNK